MPLYTPSVRRHARFAALLGVMVGWLAWLGACSGGSQRQQPAPGQARRAPNIQRADVGTNAGTDADSPDEPRVQLELSEVDPSTDTAERVRRVEGTPLSTEETRRLLSRLPSFEAESDGSDTADLASLPADRPAPTKSRTLETPFPPSFSRAPPASPSTPDAPLTIERRAPEGEVELARRLSITFSHPMVPLTTRSRAAETVPIELTPSPPGEWRWLGTRTLVFEPEGGRFPMATRYEVSIDADMASERGASLEESVDWSFETPAVRIETFHPIDSIDGPQPRRPILLATFNQRIDRDAILDHVVAWGGGNTWALELLSAERLESLDEDLHAKTEEAGEDRWIAARPVERLQTNTTFRVTFQKHMPSAEGPRRTASPRRFSFRTHAPLAVEKVECGHDDGCRPTDTWQITFNNPIEETSFRPEALEIEPELANRRIDVWEDRLIIRPRSSGQRTYRIRLPETLTDQFGQTLGSHEPLTIEVGATEPGMLVPEGEQFVVEPDGSPTCPVLTVNYATLRVQLRAVDPTDWNAYVAHRETYRGPTPPLPGQKVVERTVEIDAERGDVARTHIDLSEALEVGRGQVIVSVEPGRRLEGAPESNDRDRGPKTRWVQVTDIGLDAFVDDRKLVGWTTSLSAGASMDGVELSLLGGSDSETTASATTDAEGVGSFELPPPPDEDETSDDRPRERVLVARRGDDTAILPDAYVYEAEPREGPDLRWYVFDDRGLYRPGETVHLKGWVRLDDDASPGDLEIPGDGGSVRYTVESPRGETIDEGELPVNAHGGFDAEIALPEDVYLGDARIELTFVGPERIWKEDDKQHDFEIQQFETPAFEVDVASTSSGPHLVGKPVEMKAAANYYTGGPLAGAEIEWNIRAEPGSYAPPGWERFTFGHSSPIALDHAPFEPPTLAEEQRTSRTDGEGRHRIRIEPSAVHPPIPTIVTPETTVTDVDRRAITDRTRVLVHPSRAYVGLRTPRHFVEADESIDIEAVATDIGGDALQGTALDIRAARLEWEKRDGEWTRVETDPKTCRPTFEGDPVSCQLEPDGGGIYRITATVEDDEGRPSETSLLVWVAGADQPERPEQLEEQEVELVPGRDRYEPGDTAEILVRAPFAPAEALVTIRRDGIVETRRIRMEERTHRIEYDVGEADIPDVEVQVDLVGVEPRDRSARSTSANKPDASGRTDASGGTSGATQPAFASGDAELSVSNASKRLDVEVQPDPKVTKPGSDVSVDLQVTDSAGEPVANAEVAVAVVDEAILALTDRTLGDPLDAFYPRHAEEVRDLRLRSHVLRTFGPEGVRLGRKHAQRSMRERADSGGEIALRRDMRPLAHFEPSLETDEAGRVSLQFELPDNLTRYRILAVAAEESRFGRGSSQVTARLPLMVKPSLPAFLNYGDRAELPLVVANRTETEREVRVSLRARNLDVQTSRGKRVTVPAGDRVEVRFPAETARSGGAALQFAVASKQWSDAVEETFPVHRPATTEGFATYGTLDDDETIEQSIDIPEDVVETVGGFEVTTASTAFHQLTDAIRYLYEYPLEMVGPVASRLLGLAAIRGLPAEFRSHEYLSDENLERVVTDDLETLRTMQTPSGGFAPFPASFPDTRGVRPDLAADVRAEHADEREIEAHPFFSVHVAHALQRIREAGYDVPTHVFEAAQTYLTHIRKYLPDRYPQRARRTVLAYAYYVLDRLGSPPIEEIRALTDRSLDDELSLEAIGWLVPALADDPKSRDRLKAIRTHLNNRVEETAATAHFASSYEAGAHVVAHSKRRTDAVLLEALLATRPDSSLVPKVAHGLLAARADGCWATPQDNAFALVALRRYFETHEAGEVPNLETDTWLGGRYLGRHAFEGRTTARRRTSIPMETLREVLGADGGGETTSERSEPPSDGSRASESASASGDAGPSGGRADVSNGPPARASADAGRGAASGRAKEGRGGSGRSGLLQLRRRGEGRLYYRLGLAYAPESLDLEPVEAGFAVERTYEAVDDADDVTRRPDGTWVVEAGARVRIRVEMLAPTRRHYVSLVDPVPAGFTPRRPELATTGSLPSEADDKGEHGRYWWWHRPWYEHQNLRDTRAEVFASTVWAGVHTYTYTARATTPGTFVVPPPKVDETYHPETFGRGATDRVVVE